MEYRSHDLTLALNSTGTMIFIKDHDLNIVYANEAFLSLFSPEERYTIVGKTKLENFPADQVEGFLKEDRLALTGKTTEIIEEISDYLGTKHILLTKKSGFTGMDGKPYMIGTAIKVNDIIHKQRDLIQKNAFLEKFLPIAAHDLRSPINAMISCMTLMEIDKHSSLSDETQNLLSMMKESATTLLHQIVSLVEIHKEENAGTVDYCDLNEALTLAEFNLKHSVELTQARILKNILPVIKMKKEHAVQLIQNLVENSIKYRSTKAPLIFIKARQTADSVIINIEDNGRGVSPEADLFNKQDNLETRYCGSGIGLNVCERIVQWYNGTIEIDRDYQAGTNIVITLPHEKPTVKQHDEHCTACH